MVSRSNVEAARPLRSMPGPPVVPHLYSDAQSKLECQARFRGNGNIWSSFDSERDRKVQILWGRVLIPTLEDSVSH